MTSPRTPEQVLGALERKLGAVWAAAAAGAPYSWAASNSLGAPTGSESIASQFTALTTWTHLWRAWAGEHGVELDERARRVHGTTQHIPATLLVSDPQTAAALLGGAWPGLLAIGYQRAQALAREFPLTATPDVRAVVVRAYGQKSDLDFDILVRASHYFEARDGNGMTPRQVPIEGVHAKWLNTSQHLVCLLAGKETLGLAAPHPSRVHFTYLDPSHLRSGGRRHDCHSVGDTQPLPYAPQVVIICENKDTAVGFPEVPGGVAIEGNGDGPGAIAALAWVKEAPLVVYWGDLDADGFAILAQFRAAGVITHSIAMDKGTYADWQQYGTDHDQRGQPLRARSTNPRLKLTDGEREVYDMLCHPEHQGPRRLEQERIPYTVALDALRALA